MSNPDSMPTPRLRLPRRRITITVTLFIFIVGVLLVYALIDRIRNAPIPLGAPTGEIAFISNRGETWDVYVINPDGNVRNLTTEGDGPTANDYFVSWSMDGEMLHFLSDNTGELAPSVIWHDGTERRDLNILTGIAMMIGEGRVDWDPQWLPEGDLMVWSSLRDFNLELYIADLGGENFTPLTRNLAREWYPAISPNGQRVVYASDRDGRDNLYIINIDGTDERQLTSHEEYDIRAVWSLDGTMIAFPSEREYPFGEGSLDMYVMDVADGGNLRRMPDDMVFEGGAMWSPDGSQVAYISNRDGDWNIFVMDADGENVHRLTDSEADDLFPVWRP